MTFWNGSFHSAPNGIFNPSTPNGTHGFISPNPISSALTQRNGRPSLDNAVTLQKGDGYVAVYHNGNYSHTLDQHGNPTNGGFRFG